MTMPMRLSELLDAAGVVPLAPIGADPEIHGASLDSRRVEPGQIFFALAGQQADGLAFVPQAVERGASAVVAGVERPDWLGTNVAWVRVDRPRRVAALLSRECWGRPDDALTVVGITGTNGKTTVAYLVQAIAAAAGRRAGRIGTVGYAFADIERPSSRTTPEAPDLYRLLAQMRDERIDLVSMEVSSHSLVLDRVAGMRFATAAFLNLGRDHLDFHGTTEEYFHAKSLLFEGLDASRSAVLPADDPYGERMARTTRARVLRFGRSEAADVRLVQEHSSLEGSSAVLETPVGSLPVRTFLLGPFNLDNVAAAAACAITVGIPPEAITAGVVSVGSVPGRMEPIDLGQPFHVLVDYAHTEQALRNAVGWLVGQTRGRVRLVFGCGGERDVGKREGMGRAAAESGAVLYVTSDNPRREDPEEILRGIRAGVDAVAGAATRTSWIVDRSQAIRTAIGEAGPDDVVLLAGKGHETTQTLHDREIPFDDRSIARAALETLGGAGA
jgi:UDP-N-acetylmuramoyl-L-alanyl-D-glutamate--2,6-diaminopimelate ligase